MKHIHSSIYFGQTAKRGTLKQSCRGNKQKLSLPNVREHHKLMKWKDIAVAQTRFAISATMPLFIIWALIYLSQSWSNLHPHVTYEIYYDFALIELQSVFHSNVYIFSVVDQGGRPARNKYLHNLYQFLFVYGIATNLFPDCING